MRAKILPLLLGYISLYCSVDLYAQTTARIVVDAASQRGPVNTAIFGHNLVYVDNGCYLWDPGSKALKNSARNAIMSDATHSGAGIGGGAMVRFPNDGDTYRWRRGVGDPSLRPQSLKTNGKATDNNFGTDELMSLFQGDQPVYPGHKPLMLANWWLFNNESDTDHYDPAGGAQEAANWVEYCNGSVTQTVRRPCLIHRQIESRTVLSWASHENWQPTRFIDDGGSPSTDVNAHEALAATGRSWLSNTKAPTGYFAWLRYRSAIDRGRSETEARTPYDVDYWEIGNEIYWWLNRTLDGAKKYAEGSVSYAALMKSVDPTIRIGVSADRLETGSPPQLTAWNTGLLEYIKGLQTNPFAFVTVHPYIGGDFDQRYSNLISGSRTPSMYEATGIHSRPVFLSAGPSGATTYQFTIKARGTPSGDGKSETDYPVMSAWLIKCDAKGHNLDSPVYDGCGSDWLKDHSYAVPLVAANTQCDQYYADGRDDPPAGDTYTGNHYRIRYPWVDTTGEQQYHDYLYTITIVADSQAGLHAGYYIPWVTIPNNPNRGSTCADNGRRLRVKLISCKPEGGTEQVAELRPADDQTHAALAMADQLGDSIDVLYNAIHDRKLDLEIGATEFGLTYNTTAYDDQLHNWKSAIAVSDLARVLVDRGKVDFGCIWMLSSWLYCMAQPAMEKPVAYDPFTGCHFYNNVCNPVPTDFLMSPNAYLYKLFLEHMGTVRLASTATGTGTFDCVPYGRMPYTKGIPCLSVLATATPDDTGAYLKTLYVMVIDKDTPGEPARDMPVILKGVPAQPVSVTRYVLKHSSVSPQPSDLDAQNSSDQPALISIQTARAPQLKYSADQTVSLIDSPSSAGVAFQAGTVTVLEITISDPVSSALETSGNEIELKGKYVTAVFDDRFFIEEPSRTSGIGVRWGGERPDLGAKVDVTGRVMTKYGERYVDATSVTPYAPDQRILPLCMRNQWIGGESADTALILKGCFGFYNVGLLVQTWGKVTYVDSRGRFFYIDDGSGLLDGSGYRGLRVTPNGLKAPILNSYVRVTGICRAYPLPTRRTTIYVRSLSLRREQDIQVLAPSNWTNSQITLQAGWNVVSLAGVPAAPTPASVFVGCPGSCSLSLGGNLIRHDALLQTDVTYSANTTSLFGNCFTGEGYRLNIPSCTQGACITYKSLTMAGDQLISLPRSSTDSACNSLIGNPYNTSVPWAKCWVTDGNTRMPLPDAVSSGWIHKVCFWDGSQWVSDTRLSTGNMLPVTAFTIHPARNNLALIIPPP